MRAHDAEMTASHAVHLEDLPAPGRHRQNGASQGLASRGKTVIDLNARYKNQGWGDYARTMGFNTVASLVGALFHYGLSRTGVEEAIKTHRDFDPNNPRHVFMMALMSGLTLGASYFVINRTAVPIVKFLGEQAGLRRLEKNSAREAIPADSEERAGALDKERRSFENRTRLYNEGGLVGDLFGHASFGAAQFMVAATGYSGLWPRVIGTLAGTACEALLDTHFKFMQTFDDGENKGRNDIPTHTVAKPESWSQGWQRAKNRMGEVNVFASQEARRILIQHMVGGVMATLLSNAVKYAGRDAEAAFVKGFVAFWAAVWVVSPMYAATEFKPAASRGNDRFLHLKTAFHAVLAPFTSAHRLVPYATREPDTPGGSRGLRSVDKLHKCTQGMQAIVPFAMADLLIAMEEEMAKLWRNFHIH